MAVVQAQHRAVGQVPVRALVEGPSGQRTGCRLSEVLPAWEARLDGFCTLTKSVASHASGTQTTHGRLIRAWHR